MGLSNYIASSRISQSGVCTSTTRPASPYEGQVIYETDTDRVLVWNASAWVAPNSTTANPPGLELVATTTLSTNSTILTGCFSSSYLNYSMLINQASLSTGFDIFFRLRVGGVTNTSSIYNQQALSASGGSVGGIGDVNTQQWRAVITDTNAIGKSIINIYNPAIAANTGYDYNSIGLVAGNYTTRMGSGSHVTATAYDSIEFTTAGGNMSGTVRVYGYRN